MPTNDELRMLRLPMRKQMKSRAFYTCIMNIRVIKSMKASMRVIIGFKFIYLCKN